MHSKTPRLTSQYRVGDAACYSSERWQAIGRDDVSPVAP